MRSGSVRYGSMKENTIAEFNEFNEFKSIV